MKRNKPLVKRRRSGTQSQRRRPYWFDDRGTNDWLVIVPQALAGKDARTFSMADAVPDGVNGNPDDPTLTPGLYRWRLSVGGRTVPVYTVQHGWYKWNPDYGFSAVPRTGDVWYAFTAECKCQRSRCPLTRYYYSEADNEVPMHRPGRCPLGVPGDTLWKYAGRLTL